MNTTLSVSRANSVLFADIAAPPMNLLGPELVRDLACDMRFAARDSALFGQPRGGVRARSRRGRHAAPPSLAQRIARFPPAALATIKDRVGAITLAPAEEFRRDSVLFVERASEPAAQTRTQAAMKRGLQTPEGELALARMLDDLADG